MKGFDHADKKKLPFGPLPWPTGLPASCYVTKTNPLNGCWVTVTGGGAEFIKKVDREWHAGRRRGIKD